MNSKTWHIKHGMTCGTCKFFRWVWDKNVRWTYCEYYHYGQTWAEDDFCSRWEKGE